MLEPHGLELEFEHEMARFEHPDVDGFVAFYEQNFGPVVTAKAVLGDGWPELRAELKALFDEWNQADDGSVRIDSEYLVTVGRKSA